VRIVACQPSGCAPIARYLDGEIAAPAVARSDSAISALQLPSPPDGQLAATAVTDSGGWGTHTSDEQIRSAQRLLAATEGVFGEPAAAAALSAVMSDAGRGKLDGDDIIVLLITGAGWKDLGSFSAAAADLPRLDVAAIPEAVGRWIGGSPC
jgi:threonine synthase